MRILGFDIIRDPIPTVPQADDDLYAAIDAQYYFEQKYQNSRTIFGRSLARIGLARATRNISQAQMDLANSPDEDFYVDN